MYQVHKGKRTKIHPAIDHRTPSLLIATPSVVRKDAIPSAYVEAFASVLE